MKPKQLFLLILFTSFIGISCQKEEENYGGGLEIGEISENLYPLLFDSGSYWIYKNSENGILDSIVLINFKIDATDNTNIGHGYSHSFQTYNLTYTSQIIDDYTDIYLGYLIKRDLEKNSYLYLSSFQLGDTRSNASIAAIYDSLIVQNKVYRNIVKMEINQDIYIEDDMNLYYCDSVGIIKKEIKEAGSIIETWNLLRHHTTLYEIE